MTPPNGFVSNRVLKLNAGFLLSQSLGTSRNVDFDVPELIVTSDLTLAFLRGVLRLSRTTEGVLVQGELNTALDGECRRCLTPVTQHITLDLEELFIHNPDEAQADTTFVIADDAVLDLTPLLREEIIVNTPLALLCKTDCAGLCLHCGQNLNNSLCECETDDIDPRFAVLLQLKNQE
ncbi:DUF177 domain-containing protein [Chloroflexota bacterium]